MSKLGDYLESLYSRPDEMPVPIEASINEWQDQKIADEATGNRKSIGKPAASAEQKLPGLSFTSNATIRLPKYAHVETERHGHDEKQKTLLVMNPYQWHFEKDDGSVVTDDSGPERCPYNNDVCKHFDGAFIRKIFNSLRLEELGEISFLDRACVRFRGTLRTGDRLWPHWLPKGADFYEFVGEISTGYLFSLASFSNEKLFEKQEVTKIKELEKLDNSMFAYKAKDPNVKFLKDQNKHYQTAAAAQNDVGFTVFVPTKLPFGENVREHFHVHQQTQEDAPIVFSMYSDFEVKKHLSIQQSTQRGKDHDSYQWQTIEHSGMSIKISDPGEEGMRLISIEKDGTFIGIMTELPRELSLEIAATMVPCNSQKM